MCMSNRKTASVSDTALQQLVSECVTGILSLAYCTSIAAKTSITSVTAKSAITSDLDKAHNEVYE